MPSRTPRPVFLVPLVFLIGLLTARLPATINTVASLAGVQSPLGSWSDFDGPVDDVKQMLLDGYVDPVDARKLQEGAINGMLEALDDPYALYVPPVERAEFEKEIAGHYAGIGAVVQIEGGYPVIATPMDDSPAFRAGLHPKDKIVEINGESTVGITIDQCVEKLTGETGTVVNLTISRGGEVLPFSLRREEIIVRSVKGVMRKPDADGAWNFMLDPEDRIGYLRLTQFIPTSAVEVVKALQQMEVDTKRLGGLVLDLRDNPGGDLDTCLEIADLFLKEGQILSIRGRDGNSQTYEAHARGTLPGFALIVLVNGRSASASEILAGALLDHERAIVVGSRTFGKGLVQTVRSLPHNPEATVKFTAQRYYLPSGRMIHRSDDSTVWGVDPSPGFYVPMSDAEELALFTARQELDVINNGVPVSGQKPQMWSDPQWIENEFKDKQLAAALRAMRGFIKTNVWEAPSDRVQQAAMVSRDELRKLEKAYERMAKSLAQVEHRMESLDATLAGAPPKQPPDLWNDDIDLTDGHIEVYDKSGRIVARLKVSGRDVERWMSLADVQPETVPATATGEAPAFPPALTPREPEKP
ncbi:MAG: S41 family peptidase [Phycisphaerales bacterium]